ncbi:DNA-binding transcriptional LysR family regulator [Undibacterium pigrum]|uniref:DNA-binding transcriptional LysR family regulator n=2 Tax=Undibacterium pigrum TaxID=401470 RepID=A0A318J8P5_9BURK|nr:DNA-binding transcriptional LysR family regulator [Undibacterium pigrum]
MGMSLPLSRLAFLDQLRGFVAVGRHMSITLAADELCLSQSAVSRQIQALEQQLGLSLLVRGYRSIAFTAEGERLFRSADAALQQLQDIAGDILAQSQAKPVRPVTISASIGLTGLWLLPRLNAFQKLYPSIDVRISANNKIIDQNKDGIDLALRYTNARSVPADAIRLFDETIVPVAHPSLGMKYKKNGKLALQWPLLEFEESKKDWLSWHDWLSKEDMQAARARGILHFNQYDQLIQAAVAGQGIALGRRELIQDFIADGRLMALAPGKSQGEHGFAYWLLVSDAGLSVDALQVKDWLLSEASKTKAQASG